MKTIGASLKTHLQQGLTTIATCWKITRKDSQVFGFTDCSNDLVISGVTYLASTGQIPSTIKTTSALNVDNLEVTSILNSSTITDSDLLSLKWDSAVVEIFIVNWADLTMGTMILRKGTLGNVKTGRTAFNAELRGMMQALQQTIGRVFTQSCDAIFGDARCGLSLAGYTVTGTVTSVSGSRIFSDSSRAEASGYFSNGLITWTGGLNTGRKMDIKTQILTQFTLQQGMPDVISVGDTYSAIAGCDYTRAMCVARGNILNFRGFPDVPGSDAMVSGS